MLVAAALVPDTALLVPGSGGTVDVAATLRSAALDAVQASVADARSLVVVAPGPRTRELTGRVVATLGAAGIPDGQLAWPPVAFGTGEDARASVAASVGLHLAARCGWHGATRVVEVAPGAGLGELGASLVADGPTGLLVVGSGSGRHGPDGPLADDERAPAYDEALLADLADAGPAARARLTQRPADEAAALAVTGWAPWQVLVGAAGERAVTARLAVQQVVAGAQHAVLSWVVA
ncbi:class III extradiol ring-cleavage dioxygenase family protein [Cellulomonas edaphi]|uniref:Beta-ketoacyl synthase N-terminal domain-containing protein n=1 Tax=Cellulomonas edaphi TaxID=3053468 RepID=A0ABT7S8X0_9CELL|nr:hypothetical protein [Cellulomons edaphi]MDM7832058.1 hypothetical protein [Cellulomons edaphi]